MDRVVTIYAVTYRGTAEMVVWVEADSVAEAKRNAENSAPAVSADAILAPSS